MTNIANTLVFVAGDIDISAWANAHCDQSGENKWVFVSELQEELPADAKFIRTRLLDSYRHAGLTIRRSAEIANHALRSIRPIVGDYFCHQNSSLWLVNETNLLHFHMLRIYDNILLVKKVIADEEPVRIIGVGDNNSLLQVVSIVAENLNIPFDMRPVGSKIQYIEFIVWKVKRFLSGYPRIYLLAIYILASIKERLWRANAPDLERLPSRKRENSDAKSVTFLGTDVKQLDIVCQLYRYMEGMDGVNCRVLTINSIQVLEWLKEREIEADYLPNWSSSAISREVMKVRKKYFREAMNLLADRSFLNAFILDGTSLWSVTGEYIMRNMLNGAPNLAGVVENAMRYFKDYPSDVVVTPGEWNALSRATVIGARAEGSRSLSVQRGDITDYPGWGDPIFSDLITVNGAEVRNSMMKLGVESEKIVITGDPRMDPWINDPEFFVPGKSRRDLGVPDGSVLVVIMTNPVNLNEKASHAEEYISSLLEIYIEEVSLYFVIKLHPSEYDFEFYRRIQKRVGADNAMIIKEYHTPQLLSDADIVVTSISTTGDEAIFLGKPLMVMNLTNEPDFMPYAGSNAAVTVRCRKDVKQRLWELIHDRDTAVALRSGRAGYIRKYMHSDDGRSTARCAKVIMKLASSVV